MIMKLMVLANWKYNLQEVESLTIVPLMKHTRLLEGDSTYMISLRKKIPILVFVKYLLAIASKYILM